MEIEVTAFMYVLILVGDPGSDAYSYVCLTLSHYKILFSVACSFANLQPYELPQATFIFIYLSFCKLRQKQASSCTWHVATWKLIQECAVTEAVLTLVETST